MSRKRRNPAGDRASNLVGRRDKKKNTAHRHEKQALLALPIRDASQRDCWRSIGEVVASVIGELQEKKQGGR
jgi:hypothetical protein